MKQEYILFVIVGCVIFAYILDAMVNPLPASRFVTPYHFLDLAVIGQYPFTATSILLKTIALVVTPLWLYSFLEFNRVVKGLVLLVLSGLFQLYALQDVVSKARVLPLEWSIALSSTGLVLLIPAALFIMLGSIQKINKGLSDDIYHTSEDKQEGN